MFFSKNYAFNSVRDCGFIKKQKTQQLIATGLLNVF
jgi:hypothetical protein